MLSSDIIQQIRSIEIQTKRLLRGELIGNKRSVQRGYGIDFDQLRDYQLGDDVRFIDWQSSARHNKLLVKQYIQEHSRSIMLLVDGSASSFYGSTSLKWDMMIQVAACLALIAHYGNDQVGVVIYADEVEYALAPGSHIQHIHHIMELLMTAKMKTTGTQTQKAVEWCARLKRKDLMLILISDCIDYHEKLTTFLKRNSTIIIRCLDDAEQKFLPSGLLMMRDIETHKESIITTKNISLYLEKRLHQQKKLFSQHGINHLDLFSKRPFIADMIRFLKQRMVY